MSRLLLPIQKKLRKLGDPKISKQTMRFFKTGKGEYGEGDQFLGIPVPLLRKILKKYKELSLEESDLLLQSPFHEERLCALFVLIDLFQKIPLHQKSIYELYLRNTAQINSWDLVDVSAYHIIGPYLLHKNRSKLYTLAKSKSLWERRISIISTFAFIKQNDFQDTLDLAKILWNDSEDLIQKAVGWMLREVGKRSIKIEEKFLQEYYPKMPRTMLRYAIEKFPEQKRQQYLKGTI